MIIDLKEIQVSEVYEGYRDNADDGVVGYRGRLNIRPAFQREFIYKDKQRDEVIKTIRKNFPLNVMYWVISDDGDYELLDGQQRTVSFCQYIHGDFSIDYQYFHNLTKEEQQQILSYKLMIYICEGTEKEKLDWFEIINIAGVVLTAQELRNAIYTGEWLTDAKKYFSKNGSPAYAIAEKYMKGEHRRQAYLEAAISWIASLENKEIKEYMAEHQHEKSANELWLYFQAVINWVKATFPNYRKEMKGLEWGIFYNNHGSRNLDPNSLEEEITRLMMDKDVQKKSGIYGFLLDGDERRLNLRQFDDQEKREVYERQKGICAHCGEYFEIQGMEADHIEPWSLGGKTVTENCQMLCKRCNRIKSNR